MARSFPVLIEQCDEGIFIVECPVIEGCRSSGSTVDEALENIKQLIAYCLEVPTYYQMKPKNILVGHVALP